MGVGGEGGKGVRSVFLNAFVACLGKSCLKLHCPIRDKNFEFIYLISILSKILNFDLLKDLYCILFWQKAQLCIAVKTTKTVVGNKLIVMCKFFAYIVANRVEMKFLHYMCGCLEFQKIEAKYVFMGPSCHVRDISEIIIVCCSLQLFMLIPHKKVTQDLTEKKQDLREILS